MLKLRTTLILGILSAALVIPLNDAYARGGGRGGGGGKGGGGGGGRGGGGGGGGGGRGGQSSQAVTADQTQITTLNTQINSLTTQINTLSAKITSDYEKTQEYTDAQKAIDDSEAEAAKAREVVIDKLKTQPDYKAASTREKDGQKKVDQLRANGGSKDAILAASTDVLKAGGITSKIEKDALDADVPYQDCMKKVAAANAAMKVLKDALAQKIKDDPDVATLKTSLTSAQSQLTAANTKLQTDLASGG